MGRSCGNRHCPTCQQDKTKAWLETQTDRLLPCPYFLLTFTVPAALRAWIRSHQRIAYAALFEASSAAIKTLAADPKYVGSHAAGLLRRAAHLGPHARVSPSRPLRRARAAASATMAGHGCRHVPISSCRSVRCRSCFEPSSAMLSTRAGLLAEVDPAVWRQDWVVHSQAVGDGRASLKYLAPYVFRVAISDRRIVSCEDDSR